MITSTRGIIDESTLEKREGVDEDERARAEWVEYWDHDELVHRAVHVHIKEGALTIGQGDLGGQ